MTRQDYLRLSAPFRSPAGKQVLIWSNRLLTGLFFSLYPGMLLHLLWTGDSRLLRCLLVPGLGFVLLSLWRRLRQAKRPYEVLSIEPIMHKESRGNSFPSRHVFSAFVIAMTALRLLPPLGWALLPCGVLLALCRVVGGVHWPRDVAVGALAGILTGWLGFWIL